MVKKALKRGDKVKLSNLDTVWVERTPEEFQALRDRDAAAGRWHDDAGEPILYGAYGGWSSVMHGNHATLVVTSLRPSWKGWGRRPKGLTAGFCILLGREILFQRAV